MNARTWWRVSAVAAAMGVGLALLPPSSATQAPVVVEPADGSVVEPAFGGPVRIDLTGVAAGTYHARVVAADGDNLHSESLADVQVVESEPVGVRSHVLADALDKPGRYRVEAWQEGTGVVSVATFTVAGAEPPTVLSPGRKVRLGEPWTLKIDWSDTEIGYYDLDLRRVGVSGSCCEWWEEIFRNHEDRGIVQYQMDPITVKDKYFLQLGPWRTYFQVR